MYSQTTTIIDYRTDRPTVNYNSSLGVSDSTLAVPTSNNMSVSVSLKCIAMLYSVGLQTIHFHLMLALILPCVYVYTDKSALSMEKMSC